VAVSTEVGRGIMSRNQRGSDDAGRSKNAPDIGKLDPEFQQSGPSAGGPSHRHSFPDLNPDPILETDVEGRVLYANPAASENYLREVGETHLLAAELEPVIALLLGGEVPFVTRHVQAGARDYEQKIVHIPETGFIRIYSSETTEVRRMERALRISAEETYVLAEENAILASIGRIIAASLDINDVYAGFAEQVRKFVPFDRITISLVNLEERTFANAYIAGIEVPGREVGQIVPLAGTAINACIDARTGLIIQGTSDDLIRQYPGIVASLQSVLLLPMIYRDQLVGVLRARGQRKRFQPTTYRPLGSCCCSDYSYRCQRPDVCRARPVGADPYTLKL
jgi:hypothetical protein